MAIGTCDVGTIYADARMHYADDWTENLCNKLIIKCFRGSENDVLDRYTQVAKYYNIKNIIKRIIQKMNPLTHKFR